MTLSSPPVTPKKEINRDILAKNAEFLAYCFECIKGTVSIDYDMLAQKTGLKNAKVAATRLGQIKKQMRSRGDDGDAKVKTHDSSPTSTTASPTINKVVSKEKAIPPTKRASSGGVKKLSPTAKGGEKRGGKPKYLKLENPKTKKEVENIRNGNLRTPVSDDNGEETEYESIRVKREETIQYDE